MRITPITPSRIYTDFSFSFTRNPVTNDVVKTTDETAIKASLKNIIMTNKYERPFQPEFGCGIEHQLFENFSPVSVKQYERLIEESIKRYEPRVILQEVKIDPNFNEKSMQVHILFTIINTNKPVEVEFFIERVR